MRGFPSSSFITHFSSRSQAMGVFKNIKAVLIDLSGTIHIDDAEVPGSMEALKRLREERKLQLKFVTNTTKESKRLLLERLTGIGFTVTVNEIFTSLSAARQLIDREKLSPLLMIDDRALEEFQGIGSDVKDSVLIGLAPDKFNYENMNQAFRLVSNGAKLIAIHKARYYKQNNGLSLGPGPFVSALEFASDTKAIVVGKPELRFFQSAVSEFDVGPDQCVMIGDDVRDDVCGAIHAGMKGILVKTGKYREGDEKHLPDNGTVAMNFSEAVDMILKDISSWEGS